MSKNNIYHYFVEGECEEKLINTFKVPPHLYFQAGKVEVYNFISKKITNQRLMALKTNTKIILVYDIDVSDRTMLDENVKKLKEYGFEIYHIQSIKNFEDEIIFSTSLKNINEMYGTDSIVEFKRKFISQSDLDKRLHKENFDIDKIWSRINKDKPFDKYSNQTSIDLIRKK